MTKHKIFGKKENVNYIDRKGAYIVAADQNKIAVVKTAKGLFLLGGGIEENESDTEAIIRECMEEVGYIASVGKFVCSAESYDKHPMLGYFHPVQKYYIGTVSVKGKAMAEENHQLVWADYNDLKGKLFVKMQNWALDECWRELNKR